MDQAQIADIIEVEQLLARYAVGMTRDDIDAVIEVFTPDGTYSAFGDTYALARLPGAGGGRAQGPVPHRDAGPRARRRHRHRASRRSASSSRPPTTCASAGTPTPTAGPSRVAAAHPGHDLPPPQRRPRLRAGPRPDPAAALGRRRRLSGGAWSSTSSRPRSTPGSTSTPRELAPDYEGIGTLDEQMAQLRQGACGSPTTPASCAWAGPSGSAGSAAPTCCAPTSARRSPPGTSSSPASTPCPRCSRPTMIDYAPAALAADMVPRLLRGEETWCQGFSEPGHRQQPGLAHLPGHPRPTRAGGSTARRCGPAWPSTPQRCVLLTRTGTPESAHRGITALFVDMDSPGITVRPIETMHGARRVLRGLLRRRRWCPLDRVLGEVDGGWAVAMDLLPYERSTALWHRAAYLQRRLRAAGVDVRPAGRARPGRRRRGHRAAVGLPGPVAGDPAPAGRRRDAWVRRPRSTRCSWPRPSRRSSTSSADGARRRQWRSGTTRRAVAGAPSSSTRGRRPSTAAAPRSSATSSPAGSSISGTTADGRRAELELFERRGPPRHRDAQRRARSTRALDELGWHDALAADPRAAVSVLFEAPGGGQRHVARRSTALLADALGADGASGAAVVLPPAAPGATRRAGVDGDRCAVERAGHRRRWPAPTRRVVVASAATAARSPSSTTRRPWSSGRCAGIDPALGPGRGDRRGRRRDRRRRAPVDWDGRRGARASWPSATSCVGAARAMLELARRTRSSAIQFGRPIAAFQAVRHRLADSLVAVEAAAALLDAAWDDPSAGARPPWPRPLPAGRPGRWPVTASRCWPASGSPPSTPCTATSAGRWCSTSSSVRAACSPASSGPTCSRRGRCRRPSRL